MPVKGAQYGTYERELARDGPDDRCDSEGDKERADDDGEKPQQGDICRP